MPQQRPSAPAPAPPATQTAVIVAVPAAEPVVADQRLRFDQAATWGVPAHVTVLHPFVPPADVDGGLVADLARAVASVAAFDCSFTATRWFAEDVLWLAPDPDQPFRELTRAVWAAFPQHPPYEGAFGADVIPHLTVGERRLGSLADLRAAETAVSQGLPVKAHVDRALLMAGRQAPGAWRVLEELPLAAG